MDGNLFRLEIFKSDSALSFPAFSIVGKLQYEMQSSDCQNGENDLKIEYIKQCCVPNDWAFAVTSSLE